MDFLGRFISTKLVLWFFVGEMGIAACNGANCGTQGRLETNPDASLVSCRLLNVETSKESVPYATATVSMHNAASGPLVVVAYSIEWKGGRYDGPLPKSTLAETPLAPGETRAFRVRISYSENLDELIEHPADAKVSVSSVRFAKE